MEAQYSVVTLWVPCLNCYPLLELKLKYPHETGACLFFFWYN